MVDDLKLREVYNALISAKKWEYEINTQYDICGG